MRPFPRYLAWTVVGGLLLIGCSACTRAPDPWKDAKVGQKRVLVTFAPLYSLAHAVAGDDAYVLCCLTTDSPHDYQFSPTDLLKARNADLLVYNGLGLDDRFADKLKLRQSVPTLSLGAALPESLLLEMGEEEEEGHKHGEGHHHHGSHDPHIWLGPPQAMVMVDALATKLAEIDAAHADGYTQRAVQTKARLQQLLDEGRDRFKDKKNKKVVTMHESFGYFAKAFGLEMSGSIQLVPGQDPNPVQLSKLLDLCRKQQVGVITYEREGQEAQPRVLEKRLREGGLDVRLTEFDPMEVAPVAAGAVNPAATFYFDMMRSNIDHLAKALP